MEIGHAQNTNIRLHKLEDDVRELKLRQPVEHALTTPFIGEAVALSSVSIKEETLRDAILILVNSHGVEKLKEAALLAELASLINSAFDVLNMNSIPITQVTHITAGVKIEPENQISPPTIETLQDLKKAIEEEIDRVLHCHGFIGK